MHVTSFDLKKPRVFPRMAKKPYSGKTREIREEELEGSIWPCLLGLDDQSHVFYDILSVAANFHGFCTS